MNAGALLRIFGVGLLLIAASTVIFLLWRRDAFVVEEDDVVETSQVAFLFAATFIHLLKARRLPDEDQSMVRHGLGLLCISLAVRELEIDLMGDPRIMPTVELAVRASIVALWIVFFWRMIPSFKTLWARRVSMARSSLGLLTFAGCMFYALSWPMDKFPLELGKATSLLIEETLQLDATLMLFLAALLGSVQGETVHRTPLAGEATD